ncbi:MAG: formyltransferase family protein [Flavobacteriia bacterium]|jgi:methionyl-tRNA formyltransferase
MKLLLFIGSNPNHRALASKLQQTGHEIHIVVEKRVNTKKKSIKQICEKVVEKLFFSFIDQSWMKLMKHYSSEKFKLKSEHIYETSYINADEVIEITKQVKPDLIVVSGTSLIKEKLLSLKPDRGIVNLHTGLSPYIKGGPNCTNWCIAMNQPYFIGNTIMWIDAGIDTGNIITTEQVKLDGNEDLFQIHLKVMESAHDLYLRVIDKISKGETVPNVAQDMIAKGTTYYNKEWNLGMKFKLKRNMKNMAKNFTKSQEIQIIELS